MKGQRTKKYIEKLIAEKGIPYLDVCLYKGYDNLFRHYIAKDGEVTGKERLYLWSCTKPLTVCCAMRLVEEGKLSLDDRVSDYLPEYANAYRLDEKGNKVAVKTPITVVHLLTMSAGLTYNTNTPFIQEVREKQKGTTEEYVNAFVRAPLAFEPGERFQYSLCHDALAAVVEKASGKRFSEYMDEVIFKPLGMTDSGFHTESKGIYETYDCTPSGEMKKVEANNELVLGERYDSGGAGVISNVADYAKFAATLANGGIAENGYRLLKEETVSLIRSPVHANMQVKNSFTCVQGEEYGYGLGMRTRTVATEWGLPVGEFGWDGAAGTYLMVDRTHGISVVIGMHLLSWPNVFVGEHLKLVERLYEDMKAEKLL